MARVPAGKRIRTKHIMSHQTIAFGEGPAFADEMSWVAQDDIKIVGFELRVEYEMTDSPVVIEGIVGSALGILGRGSFNNLEGRLGMIRRAYTKIDSEFFGNSDGEMVVMFPDGCGVELDEGETITIWNVGDALGLTAGNVQSRAYAYIYWVER